MAIIEARIMTDRLQANGLRKIREYHKDDSGQEYFRDYFVEKGVDVASNLATSTANYEANAGGF